MCTLDQKNIHKVFKIFIKIKKIFASNNHIYQIKISQTKPPTTTYRQKQKIQKKKQRAKSNGSTISQLTPTIHKRAKMAPSPYARATRHAVHSLLSISYNPATFSPACIYLCVYVCSIYTFCYIHTAAEQITLLTVFITVQRRALARARHGFRVYICKAKMSRSVALLRSSGMSCVRISRTFMKSQIIFFFFF